MVDQEGGRRSRLSGAPARRRRRELPEPPRGAERRAGGGTGAGRRRRRRRPRACPRLAGRPARVAPLSACLVCGRVRPRPRRRRDRRLRQALSGPRLDGYLDRQPGAGTRSRTGQGARGLSRRDPGRRSLRHDGARDLPPLRASPRVARAEGVRAAALPGLRGRGDHGRAGRARRIRAARRRLARPRRVRCRSGSPPLLERCLGAGARSMRCPAGAQGAPRSAGLPACSHSASATGVSSAEHRTLSL